MFSFDLETHAWWPGNISPPIVCGTYSDAQHTSLVLRDGALEFFAEKIGKAELVGANIFFDLGCILATRPDLTKAVFAAIEAGQVFDTHLAEALHDNARGLLYREANGAPFNRYTLEILENRYLGIDRHEEKKGENAWRLRYAELDGLPLEQWPEEAKQYPRADARNTYDVATHQLLDGRENLHCLGSEMRAGLVLQLASMWGMRTDPVLVPAVVAHIKRKHEESRRRFFQAGIVRVRPCGKKKNKETGVSERERHDEIPREWLAEALELISQSAAVTSDALEEKGAPRLPESWVASRKEDIRKCMASLDKGVPIRFAEDKGWLATLVERAYQGSAPRTDKGAVQTSRDTLLESGDELLEAYGEEGANEKLLSTYVNVLEQGTKVPINPSTTTVLATDRVSYSKPNLQQLPRGSEAQNAEFFRSLK
jgi:hypothetical protein